MSRSENASLQLFVGRLALRSVLTEVEKQAILGLPTHEHRITAKTDFVRVSEEVAFGCFIASGLVARFGQTLAGARQITAFHIAGDMADLHAAVRPIGVGGLTALCDTTILRIPHDAIRATAARHPAIAEALWRDCMVDAAILMQWVMNVGHRNAQTRLAHILCEMAIRMSGDRDVLLDYRFPITQEQLGEASGMTSVHVNRTLMTLRAHGLVTLKGGHVRIHDWAALAEVGQFDPTYLVADTKPERQKRLLTAA
jgi:CRP-like cAMP-binding protein